MKKAHHLLLLCLPILLLLTGCKGCKDTRQPDGYIFYCKIDGKEFIPKMKTDFGYKSIEATFYNQDSSVLISADREEESVSILLTDTIGALVVGRDYILIDNIAKSNALYTPNSLSVTSDFRTNANCTGVCHITKIDKVNKILEGNFSFKAYNSVENKTVSITEGRFSLYYE